MGLKFRRQHPVGPYIVDFVCLAAWLVVELDGGQHATATDYDQRRDEWLRRQGFTVRRFWNHEVLGQTDVVLEALRRTVLELMPALDGAQDRSRGD
jgi:very-short-patch-repair endonuclease